MSNLKLRIAKREKNDEFYTLLSTIEEEVKHYSKQFIGANVLCNCDGLESNFWLYFKEHFAELGLKSLRAISFSKLGKGYLFEYFWGASENSDNSAYWKWGFQKSRVYRTS